MAIRLLYARGIPESAIFGPPRQPSAEEIAVRERMCALLPSLLKEDEDSE